MMDMFLMKMLCFEAWHDMYCKYDMIWISSMTRYEFQAWYDMLQEIHVHVMMMHDALDLKKRLSTDYSRHSTYNGTDWRSIETSQYP